MTVRVVILWKKANQPLLRWVHKYVEKLGNVALPENAEIEF